MRLSLNRGSDEVVDKHTVIRIPNSFDSRPPGQFQDARQGKARAPRRSKRPRKSATATPLLSTKCHEPEEAGLWKMSASHGSGTQ